MKQQLGTRLLAEAEHTYRDALSQAGRKINTRARTRLSKQRQAQVAAAIEAQEPMRPWLGTVGVREDEVLRNAFDTLRATATDEFRRYTTKVTEITDEAAIPIVLGDEQQAVEYLMAGLTSMVRARLLDGTEAVLAAAVTMIPRARRRPASGGFDLPGLPDPDELARAAAKFVRGALDIHEGRATWTPAPTPDHPPTITINAQAPTVVEQVADTQQLTYTWVHGFYGEPTTEFWPHADLDGEAFTDRDNDPRLENPLDWPDAFLYPKDHDTCTCEWVADVVDVDTSQLSADIFVPA